MAKLKFTAAALSRFFSEAQDTNAVAWDTEVRGLGAYRTKSGACTIFVQYRLANGNQRKKALGRLNEIAVSEARTKAIEYSLAGRHGRDLVAEQRTVAEDILTLGDAYLAYTEALERRGVSPATKKLNARLWTSFLSKHQCRDLPTITRSDVRQWHKEWGKNGPTVANQAARMLRAIINYAAAKLTTKMIENPCRAVEFFKERNLRRSVSSRALADWWKGVEQMPNPIRRAYWKFLLFTGLRREDAATLKWEDVHEDRIHRPNPKGGVTKAFDVPLTPQLDDIIKELRVAGDQLHPGSPYVFPAHSKNGYIAAPRDTKHLLGCTPHDIRRTYATMCIEADVDPYTTKSLLNHAPNLNDVTARYIIPSPERRAESAKKVALYIQTLVR